MARKTTGTATAKAEAESQELTRRCLELRLAGGSLEAIGKTVGLHKSNVSRRIKQALQDIPQDEAADLRAIENERLNVMQTAIWQKVRQGEYGAVDRALRISERRSKLNGLDAPQRVDVGAQAVDIEGVARDIMTAFGADLEAAEEPPRGEVQP